MLRWKFVLFGLATWMPKVFAKLARPTGGTDSARYCYSVWLRHLVRAQAAGGHGVPRAVAELGPGDSLGIGLAALLSGVESYYALDVHRYSSNEANLRIFDELVELFERREPIPSGDGFSRIRPPLEDYHFPTGLLSEERLAAALAPERVARLRAELAGGGGRRITYVVPWEDEKVIAPAGVDMVIAQAVMEYVDDPLAVCRAIRGWLSPGGSACLTIDYTAHHLATRWNEHWSISAPLWWALRGRQPYFLNRMTHGDHACCLREAGFELAVEERVRRDSAIDRADLSARFRRIGEEDLTTSGGYFVARSPTGGRSGGSDG